jgi:hypothetical protein
VYSVEYVPLSIAILLFDLLLKSFAIIVTFFYPRATAIAILNPCVDIGDIGNLNNTFTGTPTDLVEAVNSKTTQGFSIAMAVALG